MQISAATFALNGVEQAETKLNRTAKTLSTNPGDSISISDNAVSLLEAKNALVANVKVLKTVEELEKTTLGLAG